ncbi:MAG: glycosyltransferase, partial [Actinomycetota bacterium]|nr:glycosyltransferase [Actinomycetota bacterium]
DLLRRCLNSMKAEAASGRVEVWVIDNASSDGSAGMVEREFAWVKLITGAENIGFGAAVNEVARRAQAPWIAPSNADVELTVGALDAMLAAAADLDVGVVAPRLVLEDGETQHSVHAFPTVRLALLFAIGAYRLPGVGDRLCVEGYWRADRRREVDWAHGAFLLVRREAFDSVGASTPCSGCTPRTSTCNGGWTGRDGRCGTSRRLESTTPSAPPRPRHSATLASSAT